MFPTGLLSLLALAAALRVRGLMATGLSSDEAVYVGQGAALAGDPAWPAVRAHPPVLGLLVDLVPPAVPSDVAARSVSVALGLAAVAIAGLLGRELGGRVAGLVAAAVVAVMPYHVDVTRLALVDVPMATAAAGALLLVVRAARTGRGRPVEAAGAVLGVAVLCKETAVLTVVAVALAVLAGDPAVPRRTLLRAGGWFAGVVALYPGWLAATGRLGDAAAYASWQAARTGSDPASFYVDLVAPRVGWAVCAAALVGAVLAGRARVPGVTGVVLAVVVPLGFYAVWPVRGYPYLLAAVVPLAAIAGVGVAALVDRVRAGAAARAAAWGAAGARALAGPATAGADPPPVPGAAGVPALREAATWLRAGDVPSVVTAAPWVANVVRHYAPGVPVETLAVTDVDPSGLNPAYRDVLRTELPPGRVAVVWDAWSADVDPAGTAALLDAVHRREGRVAHVELSGAGSAPRILVVVFILRS